MNHFNIALFGTIFSMILNYQSLAQLKPPMFDFQLKAGISVLGIFQDLPTEQLLYEYEAASWTGEGNVNISERFAIGAFYARGADKSAQVIDNSGFGGIVAEYEGAHQFYGLKLRLSSGLRPKLRPFIEVSGGYMNMTVQNDTFNESLNTSLFGGSLGLMIKLNNHVYLVLPQLRILKPTDSFSFSSYNNDLFVELLGGISFNIGKRK